MFVLFTTVRNLIDVIDVVSPISRFQRSKLPGAAGYYVLRESTSVPDAFVISILLRDGDIEHVILTKTHDGAFTITPDYTRSRALSFPSLPDVVDYGYTTGFSIREHTVKLGRCIHGESLAK
eukprot:m.92350 g.92350  ORF g.92350 m.92350 type:complete len:122 (-) comp12034_c0_seq2:41-406(-)